MAGSQQIAGGGGGGAGAGVGVKRQKVMLMPGHSQMDWMRRVKSGEDLAGTGGAVRRVSMREVALHCTEADAWCAIRGLVFNLTPYLKYHPGGVDQLMRVAGRDGTALFNEIHAWVNLEVMMRTSVVGMVADVPFDPPPAALAAAAAGAAAAAQDAADGYANWRLQQRVRVSDDCLVLCFVPPPGAHEDTPPGGHVLVRATIDGHQVVRPYTPINAQWGRESMPTLELLVKRYEHGAMSRHLHALAVGATVAVSRPRSELVLDTTATAHLVMVAAGTGVTAMWRLLVATLRDEPTTTVELVCAQRTERDLLLGTEFDALAEEHPTRLRVVPVLSAPGPGWTGARARLTAERLGEVLRSRGDDASLALVCGPPAFAAQMTAGLARLGFGPERVHVFGAAGASAAAEATGPAAAAAAAPLRAITRAEAYAHNTPTDLWLVIAGKVYNASSFVASHPGGNHILRGAGHDASADFAAAFHSPAAVAMLAKFLLGTVAD